MPHHVGNHENVQPVYSDARLYDFVPPPLLQERPVEVNMKHVAPTTHVLVAYITANDVLCGRGAASIQHPGNKYFRSLVKDRQEEYATLRRQDKSSLVREILQSIDNRNGRFLRQLGTGEWVEVHDAISYEKTCQALREYQKTRKKSSSKKATSKLKT
mmetsp:Transcript_2504/g.3687  ORF Transcript_2504/g.3687 Transcript_2504/m.3687 type:complete len:158 (-) Transcript_2504:220-693(-)|eukprot:CAMPEP_0194209870 /NCGR_PEP_ID=MMETSP0156-20130528/7851_1 /TAXON_ID=33649 /ORGANISM="Thalassionema nitzschioides, Strain L26-B" /LENGTH=157 /DNA_ID=CAMNT_0038937121 /DNA_START=152 /DNA_END=625 /DNA_ORIENTATION=+